MFVRNEQQRSLKWSFTIKALTSGYRGVRTRCWWCFCPHSLFYKSNVNNLITLKEWSRFETLLSTMIQRKLHPHSLEQNLKSKCRIWTESIFKEWTQSKKCPQQSSKLMNLSFWMSSAGPTGAGAVMFLCLEETQLCLHFMCSVGIRGWELRGTDRTTEYTDSHSWFWGFDAETELMARRPVTVTLISSVFLMSQNRYTLMNRTSMFHPVIELTGTF